MSVGGPASSVVVEADGGSRGNPGPAGYGALVRDADSGALLAERAESIGIATNNVAEYSGLIAGLEAALELGAREVAVRMDSKLVVEQMSGRWRVKHPAMKPLATRASTLSREFDSVSYTWIPRAQNSAADALANSAMDGVPVRRDFVDEPDSASDEKTAVRTRGDSGWSGPSGPATTTLLIRHGSSVLSPERRFSGRGDVPLSPEGREQVEWLAARLGKRGGIDAVVSSPLRRARHTAAAIASPLGLPVEIDEDLVETDFGGWEGLTIAEVDQRWPEEVTAWRTSTEIAPPGGESFVDTERRVRRALDRIRARSGTVAVVSHVTPVKTLLRIAFDAPTSFFHRLRLDTAGLSEVDWNADGSAVVRLVNDTAHLEGR